MFLAFPYCVCGTYHVYQRFAVFLVPLWFIVWNAPEKPAAKRQWLVIGIIMMCAFVNIYRYTAFVRKTQGLDWIIDTMEPGKMALLMIVDKRNDYFADIVYEHFSLWYQVRRRGITEFNFAYFSRNWCVIRKSNTRNTARTSGMTRLTLTGIPKMARGMTTLSYAPKTMRVQHCSRTGDAVVLEARTWFGFHRQINLIL